MANLDNHFSAFCHAIKALIEIIGWNDWLEWKFMKLGLFLFPIYLYRQSLFENVPSLVWAERDANSRQLQRTGELARISALENTRQSHGVCPLVSSHRLAIVLRIDKSFLFLWWRVGLQLMALVDCRWCWWSEYHVHYSQKDDGMPCTVTCRKYNSLSNPEYSKCSATTLFEAFEAIRQELLEVKR